MINIAIFYLRQYTNVIHIFHHIFEQFQLVKANKDLAQNQSQHAEEMKKFHTSNGIDIDNFTRLQIDLVDQQRQLRELQEFIEAKENEKNKKFKGRF